MGLWTEHAAYHGTWPLHRLSVLVGLVDNSPLDSRLHLNASHAKECLTHHPRIESVAVGCLCQCCTHKSSFTLSSYFAHGGGAPGYSFCLFTGDPWQYVMATVEELLTRLVNLENKAVQARQRQASAEQALAVAQQRIAQLSLGTDVATTPPGVIDTRTLGKPKSFSGQTSEWTTWQFTFKAFACAVHPKMKEVFDLATRKGADRVNASDITGELQSLSTQLYYMLVMMLSDEAQEIVPFFTSTPFFNFFFFHFSPFFSHTSYVFLQNILKYIFYLFTFVTLFTFFSSFLFFFKKTFFSKTFLYFFLFSCCLLPFTFFTFYLFTCDPLRLTLYPLTPLPISLWAFYSFTIFLKKKKNFFTVFSNHFFKKFFTSLLFYLLTFFTFLPFCLLTFLPFYFSLLSLTCFFFITFFFLPFYFFTSTFTFLPFTSYIQ